MKELILTCIIAFVCQSFSYTQCGINQKELRDKYCTGTYLVHSELDNSSPDVKIALKKGNRYAIYLFNSNQRIKDFSMTDSRNKTVSLESRVLKDYSVYRLTPEVSDTYEFRVDFGTDKYACVLWTIYMHNENHLVPGFYRNLEELKYNNPSDKFNYAVTEQHRKYFGGEINTYKIDIDKLKAREIGKVFGFSDGKNLYLNEDSSSLRPSTEFARAEYHGKYYYFETVLQIPVSSGTTVILVPKIEQKIMDMNSGEIIILNNKNLKELISDNQLLLAEFENSSHKNRILKEFFIRYMRDKFPE
jgi:hypothetical protein